MNLRTPDAIRTLQRKLYCKAKAEPDFLYMNRFLKYWRRSGRGGAWQPHIINSADDFVILSRGHAAEAMAWTDHVMTRLGLTLNRTKTRLCDARQERFDFLGYSFGPHCFRQTGQTYIGASPSKKSVQRLKDKMGAMLVPGNMGPWREVRGALNRVMRGWCGYFSPGSHYATDRVTEAHVYDRVRNFLVRRHKMRARETGCLSNTAPLLGSTGGRSALPSSRFAAAPSAAEEAKHGWPPLNPIDAAPARPSR